MSSIPQPQGDEQGKIVGDFYPLTAKVAKRLREAKLTAAEWRIWSYLVELDPWGNRYQDLATLTVMSECEVSKATFYRAVGKLQELGLFDFQDKGWSFKNETGVSKMRQKKSGSSLKNETGVSKMRIDSQECENQPPEPLPQADSKTSQNIQTYSDLNQTTTTDKDNVAAAAEEKVSKPKSEEQVLEENSQNEQPTEEEVIAALQNVADAIPEIKISSTVKKFLIKFWVNFPLALAATEEAVGSGSLTNPTGFFIEALKNPVDPPKLSAKTTNQPKREWKYEDDWTQHPQYARWLPMASKNDWGWVQEATRKEERRERGLFFDWCQENKTLLEEDQT